MPHFNEHALEMAIMELFEQQGYSYVNGETIHKEQSEVLLRDDLRMYLMNKYAQEGITLLEVERVIATLAADNGAPLYQQNAQTYRLMTEGFAIKREDASQPDLFVEVIDFKDVDDCQPTGHKRTGTTHPRRHRLYKRSAHGGTGVQKCREGRHHYHECLYTVDRALS